MKTLPEIVKLYSIDVAYAARRQKVGNLHQEQQLFIDAIAKELMGCLPEKIDLLDTGSLHGPNGRYGIEAPNAAYVMAHNQALDEVRARLTAFIGHKEK